MTNCEKYRTESERMSAFNKICVKCKKVGCDRLFTLACFNAWLDDEAKEEKKEYRLATRDSDGTLYVGQNNYETREELERRIEEVHANGLTSWFGIEREVGEWKEI